MELQKGIHEGFAQFFEAPTRDTLRELLRVNLGETDQLDFKEEWSELMKMAKHVIAIGNSGGGAIVVGVREENDGSLIPVGLNELLDKSKVGNEFERFVPPTLKYEVLSFDLSASEYDEIEGDRYQAILVDPDEKVIPYLPLRESKGIKANRIYVRRDTKSVEANRTEIERLIETRVNAISRSVEGELQDDLQQLKMLCREEFGSRFNIPTGVAGYRSFLNELIQAKEDQIRQRIGE